MNNTSLEKAVAHPPLLLLLIPRVERFCHSFLSYHNLWLKDWLQAGTVQGKVMIPEGGTSMITPGHSPSWVQKKPFSASQASKHPVTD